ncbi:MAG: adenosylmethionine--8-amino-7-oxononanoate transaminase [Proteobacteria bacterium]|uniref:adenosylmethionine--8-amino-7-oxononanoate transaminase n=1 Tax=Rudaea sp. TaxID=2136325 RepID=UPI0037836257|nr:adenosylmethionine--8-amino-7-oxononanoate transaminase [Pseudomonadota bacterium]
MTTAALPDSAGRSTKADWAARDLAVLWHPCTQMRDHADLDGARLPLTPIARGEGAWLVDHEGGRYLDAVSSWWTNLFGHANPRIAAAIKDQLDKLEHVIFAGFSHEPGILLAEELLRIAPAPRPALPGEKDRHLARVFYGDNGSSAIEIALKMSFHYWRNLGREGKQRFIALSGGYHGETLGALTVTDVPLYRATYAPLLGEPIFVASPDCYARAPGEDWQAHSLRKLADMRAALERHAHEVSAVIVEPLVQCAGGMRMYHPAYLAGLRRLCDEFEVHLIADEIAVGFGRTGTLFACEQANVTPDFLCLSKGITGGFLPFSAVLTTARVYDAFYAEYAAGKAFLHSHSYTGNALACRAALETLAIFRDEPVIARNRVLAQRLRERLAPLADHPHVAEVRQTGMIAAVELVRDKATRAPFPVAERRGLRAYRHALAQGVLLRPLGDVIYFMPPYVITPDEIDFMVEVAVRSIEVAVAS